MQQGLSPWDAAWVGPSTLAFFGVPVANIIIIMAFVYGAIRCFMAGVELYEWWQKRKEKKNVEGK